MWIHTNYEEITTMLLLSGTIFSLTNHLIIIKSFLVLISKFFEYKVKKGN